MATTTDLNITLLETGQTQKEGLEVLGRAVAGLADLTLAGDHALSAAEARCAVVRVTGQPAPAVLTVPARRQVRAVLNAGAHAVTVTAGGAGVAVGAGSTALLYCDGTDVVTIVGGAPSLALDGLSDVTLATPAAGHVLAFDGTAWANAAPPFDLALFIAGTPTAGETCLRHVFARAVSFPAGLAGSRASAGSASAGTVAFSLRKNGAAFGALTFAAGAAGTFAAASPTTFAPGDVLTVLAPDPADAALADVALTLVGPR